MDTYGECPSYLQIIATQPIVYLDQANLLTAWALGIASGLLAALIGRRRHHRPELQPMPVGRTADTEHHRRRHATPSNERA